MEKQINERFIVFAGSKAGGSQCLPIPRSIVLEENKDIVVSIGGFSVVYNCIKEELFNNQDGTKEPKQGQAFDSAILAGEAIAPRNSSMTRPKQHLSGGGLRIG